MVEDCGNLVVSRPHRLREVDLSGGILSKGKFRMHALSISHGNEEI